MLNIKVCCFHIVFQIGAANPRLQKVLDALDAIKNKVKSAVSELVKYRFAENKCARTVCAEQFKGVGN